MAKRAGGPKRGRPRARTGVPPVLATARGRKPARPLRATGRRGRVVTRAAAVAVALALVGPLGVTAPLGAAQESDQGDGRFPYWKVLRSESEKGAEDDLRPWTKANLRAVHFPTDQVGYAVGDDTDGASTATVGTVLRTKDGGDSWEVWRLKGVGPLNGVHAFIDESGREVVHAVGAGGVIVRSVDGGGKWFLVSSGVGVDLHAVHFPTPEVGYVVGDPAPLQGGGVAKRYTVLKTFDEGVSWERQAVLLAEEGRPLYAVHFADAKFGAAVGGEDPPAGGNAKSGTYRYLRTKDGGASWMARSGPDGIADAIYPRPVRGVALLKPDEPVAADGTNVVEYAVGPVRLPQPAQVGGKWPDHAAAALDSVRRATNPFALGALGNPERAVRGLYGVTAYYPTPVTASAEVPGEDEDEPEEVEEDAELPEMAHAVGSEGGLPAALTRLGRDSGGAWVVEPVEDWALHEGLSLRAVSASPGGETVVAVGDGGLMLRRSTDPDEVAEAVCVPPALAEELEELELEIDDEVPVCPKIGDDPRDPDGEKEPVFIPPPRIEPQPDIARAGEQVTVKGRDWRRCQGSSCKASKVALSFRQGDKVFSLGAPIQAGKDGTFTGKVTVPGAATAGPARVHAIGDPRPDGGGAAGAPFTVKPPLPVPEITLAPDTGARPGEELTVTGQNWHECDDPENKTPQTCRGSTIELTLRQGGKIFELGEPDENGKRRRLTVQAGNNGSLRSTPVRVPDEVTEGKATVHGLGKNPPPSVRPTGEREFDVVTGCRISVGSTNPEFPCLTNVELTDEEGNAFVARSPNYVFFDPGLGEPGETCGPGRLEGTSVHGRVVIGIGPRIYLYDLECLSQRGAPGFGKQFVKEGKAYPGGHGDETGVVNTTDHGPGFSFGGQQKLVALDPERHVLYLATGGAVLPDIQIRAVSLTGQFAPAVLRLSPDPERLPNAHPTHLALDAANGMVYAAITSGIASTIQLGATTTPQREVRIHAVRARVVGKPGDESMDLQYRWSLNVGDLCASTEHDKLHFFGVSRQHGRHLSLPCKGTDFTLAGFPQVYPKGLLIVTLPGGKTPDEVVQDDAQNFIRRFEPVPGGGMGSDANKQYQAWGDQGSGVLVWKTGRLYLFWDLDEAMWIGALEGGAQHLIAGDPVSRRLYLGGGFTFTLFEVANLPGGTERLSVDTGVFGHEAPPSGAFDPRTRRLVVAAGVKPLRVLEDRIPPPIAFPDPNPDARTHDIDDAEAFSVERGGVTSAYGARVWWTGPRGTLPGTGVDTAPLTWDWLYSGGGIGGGIASWPGVSRWTAWKLRDSGRRELFSARVEDASLAVQTSAFSESVNGLSEAIAWGVDPDDGTNVDLRSRRGTGEWRNLGAAEVERFCDNLVGNPRVECRKRWFGDPNKPDDKGFKAQWERFYYGDPDNPNDNGFNGDLARRDECMLELYDRAFREVDGNRQVHPTKKDEKGNPTPNPCFPQFDEHDPHRDKEDKDEDGDTNETTRKGLEEEAGLTPRARCADPGGETKVSTGAARVMCNLVGGRTEAGAESPSSKNAISSEFPGGVTVRVDGAFSDTRSYLDPDRGMVSAAEAFAQGVEVAVKGLGRLRIGQVATRAEAWANGRPGGAGSSYRVGYADVAVSTEDGQVVFSCDPHGELSHTGKETVEEHKKMVHDHKKLLDEQAAAAAAALAEALRTAADLVEEEATTPAASLLSRRLRNLARIVENAPNRAADALASLSDALKDAAEEVRKNGGPIAAALAAALRAAADEVDNVPAELTRAIKNVADVVESAPDEAARVLAEVLVEPTGCDPQEISNKVGLVLGGVVDMVAPTRDTDPRIRGTDGGARAIARRNRRHYWNDRVLFNVDLDEIPGLQLAINADGVEYNRYRVDLAAVFAESNYYIGKLKEAVKELPATIQVSLTDPLGTPLRDGRFEVVADRDGDGALGAVDAAVAHCLTGSDGMGDCSISSLDPGAYLVRQLEAPPGYLAEQSPVVVHAAPGSTQTVPFVNVLNAGTVEVTLVDPSGSPLEGGAFELTHESGASESCSTDREGRCEHWPLPLGGYTLTQTRAPSPYEPADPVSFELASPGQIARINVVNGLAGESGADVVIIESAELTSSKDDDGSWWKRVARGLARVIRRNPWQALAFALLALMAAAPAYLAARRREFSMMRELT